MGVYFGLAVAVGTHSEMVPYMLCGVPPERLEVSTLRQSTSTLRHSGLIIQVQVSLFCDCLQVSLQCSAQSIVQSVL